VQPKPEHDGFAVDCSRRHGVSGRWFEQAESRTRQGIMRTLASYLEDSRGPEETFVLIDFSDWFLQVGILASPHALLETMQLTRTQFKRNCFLLE
jgi:hypothetical protein